MEGGGSQTNDLGSVSGTQGYIQPHLTIEQTHRKSPSRQYKVKGLGKCAEIVYVHPILKSRRLSYPTRGMRHGKVVQVHPNMGHDSNLLHVAFAYYSCCIKTNVLFVLLFF
jgi:hypothetical protein